MNLLDYASEIKFYDELPTKGKRILVYALSGGGKTHFCGTSPNPYFIDTDGGGETLRALHVPHVSLTYGDYDTKGKMGIIRLVEKMLIDCRDQTGPWGYGALADRETLCIDSFTALDDMVSQELMVHPENKEWGVRDPLQKKPTFDHWGAKLAFFTQICSILKDISSRINVIVTAGMRVNDDPQINKIRALPDISGQFRGKIGAYFDYVLYLEDLGKEYVAHTRPHGLYNAKIRQNLPPIIKNPKFADLCVGGKA